MGWYGLQQAILARDVDELVLELSPHRNPNDAGSAIHVAVKQMTPAQLEATYTWADGWLRERVNDPLRARGDARWQAVNLVEQVTKAHLGYHRLVEQVTKAQRLEPWMAIAMYGSWHPDVPAGKVLVHATRGGVVAADAPRRKFLLSAGSVAGLELPFVVYPEHAEEVP